jgi:hypothetical protein
MMCRACPATSLHRLGVDGGMPIAEHAQLQDLEKTAFDDEAERRKELAEKRRGEQVERLRDAYNQLKYTAVSLVCALCPVGRWHPFCASYPDAAGSPNAVRAWSWGVCAWRSWSGGPRMWPADGREGDEHAALAPSAPVTAAGWPSGGDAGAGDAEDADADGIPYRRPCDCGENRIKAHAR